MGPTWGRQVPGGANVGPMTLAIWDRSAMQITGSRLVRLDEPSMSNSTSWLSMTWWRHQMEEFSALLAICTGNSPVTGEIPAQRLVTRSFDVVFDIHLNKRLSKQAWGWWFETPSRPLWRHSNGSSQICQYFQSSMWHNIEISSRCVCRFGHHVRVLRAKHQHGWGEIDNIML